MAAILGRLRRQHATAEELAEQAVIEEIFDLEEDVGLGHEVVPVAAAEVIIGEAAEGFVTAAAHAQVDDDAILDAFLPGRMHRVGQEQAGLDEVESLDHHGAIAGAEVAGQEAVVAVEEKEQVALNVTGAVIAAAAGLLASARCNTCQVARPSVAWRARASVSSREPSSTIATALVASGKSR